MPRHSPLPSDAASIRKLAARSMFDLFSSVSEGMMLVDRSGRVIWINDSYKRFLPSRAPRGPGISSAAAPSRRRAPNDA